MASDTQLNHEQLDVYRVSVSFMAHAIAVTSSFPRGQSYLADQLRRASSSIPLNIAEGYGKRTVADRARFYAIARGSAHECGAIFDIARELKLVELETWTHGKRLLVRIVKMLVKLAPP